MQSETFAVLNQFLIAHPSFGILFAFLVSFLESLAVIGSIIPGSVTLTAVGVLIGMGIVATIPTISFAILGAFIGDSLSFWLGKKYSTSLQSKWPFTAYPKLLPEGEAFFNQYGNLSIFIGRFVGPIRCILPVSAGILQMNTTKFIVADLLSAIVWAPTYLMPGILIGAASLELEADTGPRLLAAIFIILIVLWLTQRLIAIGSYFCQKQLLKVSIVLSSKFPRINQHFYRDHQHRCRTFYLICSTLLLTTLIFCIKHNCLSGLNQSTWHFFQSFRFLNLSAPFTFLTLFADKYIIYLTLLSLAAFWFYQKEFEIAYGLIATGAVTLICAASLKHGFAIARPPGLVHTRETYSFPSGHSALISMFLSYLYLTLTYHIKRSYHEALFAVNTFIIVVILLTRLYLGAHWLTDVATGVLLGFSSSLLASTFYNPAKANQRFAIQSIIFTVCTWILLTTSYAYFNFNKQFRAYQIKPLNTHAIPYENWWQQTTPLLPLARHNYADEADVALNIQWYQSESKIISSLKQHGWKKLHTYNWLSFANRLAHFGSKHHLPLFPKQFHFKIPKLTFTKYTNKNTPLIILRLWSAPVALMPETNKQLFIGSVHYRYLWHKQTHTNQTDFPYPAIANTLSPLLADFKWKKLHYPVILKHSLELDEPNTFYLITE